MKTILKSIILLFVIISLSACANNVKRSYNDGENFENYKVVVIDGCEYIQWRTSYGYLNITHKGNCDNPIHKK